jgi:hypothetical protein
MNPNRMAINLLYIIFPDLLPPPKDPATALTVLGRITESEEKKNTDVCVMS